MVQRKGTEQQSEGKNGVYRIRWKRRDRGTPEHSEPSLTHHEPLAALTTAASLHEQRESQGSSDVPQPVGKGEKPRLMASYGDLVRARFYNFDDGLAGRLDDFDF